MISLFQSVLADLEKKITQKNTNKEKIALVISTVIHTTITTDQISVRNTQLIIQTNPTIKMACILNKEKIIQNLQQIGINIQSIH